MEISPCGSHVLVSFRGGGPGKELIVVASIVCDPIPSLKHM